MNKDYLDSIDRAMARERAFMLAMQETALAGRLLGVRRQLGSLVRNVSCTDDLPQMIASEKLIVERDLEFHANSKGMVSSLTTALNEIRAIEQHITMVDDPVQYRVVNRAYSLPKTVVPGCLWTRRGRHWPVIRPDWGTWTNPGWTMKRRASSMRGER